MHKININIQLKKNILNFSNYLERIKSSQKKTLKNCTQDICTLTNVNYLSFKASRRK